MLGLVVKLLEDIANIQFASVQVPDCFSSIAPMLCMHERSSPRQTRKSLTAGDSGWLLFRMFQERRPTTARVAGGRAEVRLNFQPAPRRAYGAAFAEPKLHPSVSPKEVQRGMAETAGEDKAARSTGCRPVPQDGSACKTVRSPLHLQPVSGLTQKQTFRCVE